MANSGSQQLLVPWPNRFSPGHNDLVIGMGGMRFPAINYLLFNSMNKLRCLLIFALVLLGARAAAPVSQYCSAYCATCNGVASTNCVTCPTGFNFTAGSCIIDTTVYTSVLQSHVSSASFSDNKLFNCGPSFPSLPGFYNDNYAETVANLATVPPHYSMRARIFILWIDMWASGESVDMHVDGVLRVQATYSQANGTQDQCKRTDTDVSYILDTGDFAHNTPTAVISLNVSACANTPKCMWALKDLILLVKACHAYCGVCTSSLRTDCSACVVPYFLTGTTCDTTCGAGYYNSTATLCSVCGTGCTACSVTATNCSACSSSYYLLNGNSCVSSCPALYFINGSLCSLCATGCGTCTANPTPCQSCTTGYFLSLSACVTTCPSGTYGNSATLTCDSCDLSCTLCNVSAANCSACTSAYVLFSSNFTCLSNCPAGYFNSSGTCSACLAACATCTGNPSPCQSCTSGWFLSTSTCVATCPVGTFGNTVTHTCDSCNAICTACNGSAVNCSACASGYALFSSNYTCLASCPTGYYNSSGTCATCNGSCLTCTGNPSPCQSCASGWFLSTTTCVVTCPVGTFGNTATNTCDACNSICTACNGTAVNCSACATSYALFSSNYTCLASCPAGYYNSSGTCAACNGSCATCTGNPSPCQSCVSGWFLSASTCITTCPLGTFGNTATNTCDSCNVICTACNGTATNCSACAVTYLLFSSNYTCLASCPAGYFNSSGTCATCNGSCAACTGNPSPCQSCTSGWFLSTTTCVVTCPVGTFGNTATNTCDSCNAICTACNGTATNCSACVPTYLLFSSNFTCLASCPAGYYNSSGTCTACSIKCATCTGNPTPCQTCNTGWFLLTTSCVTTCPALKFANSLNNKCDPCDAACLLCNGTSSNCSSCITSFALFSSNFTCLLNCPTGWWENTTLNTCIQCDVGCAVCTGTPVPCQACNTNYYTYLTGCVNPCPSGFYADTFLGSCQPCTSNCTICTNSATNCSACITNYYLVVDQSICLSACPATLYYPVVATKTCVHCGTGCQVCAGPASNCSVCLASYYYYASSNLCTLSCPVLTTGTVTWICVNCDPSCLSCSLTAVNCTSCIATYVLFQSNYTCITACPTGYVKNSSNICQTCQTGCVTCTGIPTPCQSCTTGYFLSAGACGTTCPAGTWGNTVTHNCDTCSTNCTTCTSAVVCQTCSPGYYWYRGNSSCLNPCPTYYFINATTKMCDAYFCSPYCQSNGCSGVNYNQCLNCSSYYIYNSTTTTCYPDPARYLVLFQGKNDTSIANVTTTGDCGLAYVGMPGLYGPSTNIQIFADNIIQNHFRIRMRMAVIFIDDWTSGNYVAVNMDGTNNPIAWYQNAQAMQQQCGTAVYERSVIIDSGDIGHVNHNVTIILKSSGCTNAATCRWMYRQPLVTIILCSTACLTCNGTAANSCQSCANTTTGNYLLSNLTCALTCHVESFQSGPNMCTFCVWNCTRCNVTTTNCTACRVLSGYVYLPDNSSCPLECPLKYYNQTNVCMACPSLCATCTSATVCQTCVAGNYFLNNFCYGLCPSPLYDDNYTWTCLTFQQYFVFLTIEAYFVQGDILNIDMGFSQALDWGTFPYQSWQTFNTSSYPVLTMSNYQLTYSILNDSAYRIQITTNDFTFLKNETISMLTNDSSTPYTSLYGRPFYKDNYNVSTSKLWNYIKITNMSSSQEGIYSTFVEVANGLNSATSPKYVQEVKKFGTALLLANSLQITSCMLLVNTVLPKNFYEGVRLFASLIFFDVPSYQMESSKQKYLVVPTINDLTSRRRLLAVAPLDQTNFRRMGFTGMFLFDAYPQVIVLVLLWLLIIPFYFLRATKWGGRFYGYFHSALHKFTDLAIMYFTLALLFEFAYFQDQPVRYVSLILCICGNVYLLLYELYRYYDLAAYRYAEIGTPEYERYVQLYGGFLKYLRYVPYAPRKQGAWMVNWREPCSYHIVSYIKKLLMMFALAVFYERAEVQMSALVLIQIGEILRFWFVWPFRSRFYNWLRFSLQLVLLSLFACIFACVMLLQKIMTEPTDITEPDITAYYIAGWVALILVFFFNCSFLLIFFYDFFHGLKYTNKDIIDTTRKEYYAALLGKYEKGNEEVPERLLKDWSKRGMVDQQKLKKVASGAKIMVENYKIKLEEDCYVVDINKTIEFQKRREFTLVNNAQFLKPSRTIEHSRNVEESDELFPYINRVFDLFATEASSELEVKSFIYEDQSKYKIGQKVELEKGNGFEYIVTVTDGRQSKNIKLDNLVGFPIPIEIFKRLYLM